MKKLLAILLLSALQIASASSEWTESTYELRSKLEKVGFKRELATYVIDKCKSTAIDPRHCVVTASFIAKAESNCGNNAKNNNVWGINEWKKYSSVQQNFDRWIKSYNIWWYKTKWPKDFYPLRGHVSKTAYCTDEESSGSKVWCPFWRKHSEFAFAIVNNPK